MNATAADSMERSSLLRAVVIGSSALGLGMLLASLTGLELGTTGFDFHWHISAVPAFLIGAAVAAGYWRLVFRLGAGADKRSSRRRLYVASGLLILLAIAVFMYPLRFVAAERRHEVFVGLGVALGALSCLGAMITVAIRMLQADDAAGRATEAADESR